MKLHLSRGPAFSRVGVVILLLLLWAAPAQAQQAGGTLSDLQIAVWPEYDQPAVLVIYDGTLDAGVSLPQQIRLPIPAEATVHAVAYRSEEGQLLTLPWAVETTDQGPVVVFETEEPRFVVEYYADIIAPPPQRSFDLPLALPAAASQVTLSLRQPTGASNIRIDPALASAGLDSLGNPQYTGSLGAGEAGETIRLAVSYDKASAAPSVVVAATPSPEEEPAAAVQADSGTLPDWVPVAIGVGLGLVVAGGAIYLINRSRQASGDTRQARRRKARQAGRGREPREPRPASADTGQDQFCRQCGQKFTATDRFCRNCGAARQ